MSEPAVVATGVALTGGVCSAVVAGVVATGAVGLCAATGVGGDNVPDRMTEAADGGGVLAAGAGAGDGAWTGVEVTAGFMAAGAGGALTGGLVIDGADADSDDAVVKPARMASDFLIACGFGVGGAVSTGQGATGAWVDVADGCEGAGDIGFGGVTGADETCGRVGFAGSAAGDASGLVSLRGIGLSAADPRVGVGVENGAGGAEADGAVP